MGSGASAKQRKAVGIYIFDAEGRALLTQRGPKARHEQYKWEGPGGAVDEGETFEQAAEREILEELGVAVILGEVIYESEDVKDSNGDIWHSRVFRGTIKDQPLIQEPDKCVGFGWFTPEEAKKLALADYAILDFQHLGWL